MDENTPYEVYPVTVPQESGTALLNTYSQESQQYTAAQTEHNKRVRAAKETVKEPDTQQRKREANRAYRRELGKCLNRNSKLSSTKDLDVKIARRLAVKGYSRAEIHKALRECSPVAAKAVEKQKYSKTVQKEARKRENLRKNKAIRQRYQEQQKRQEQQRQKTKEKELKVSDLSPKQAEKVAEWRKAKEQYEKNPKQELSLEEKVKVLKGYQHEREGLRKAVSDKGDVEVTKNLIKNGKANPADPAFHKAIGKATAERSFVHAPEKRKDGQMGKQEYGNYIAHKGLKKHMKDEPNFRPENQKHYTAPRRDATKQPEQSKQPTKSEQRQPKKMSSSERRNQLEREAQRKKDEREAFLKQQERNRDR